MAKTETPETDTETGDAPLIDLNDVAIKKLIARAKKRGVITYDELNEALPQDQMSSEQIEDIMSAISEMGVNIVENERFGDDEEEEKEPEEEVDPLDDGGPRPRRRDQEGSGRPHRRPGAHVPARDGRGGIALPRGRDRHRQAHRGRPRHDDLGPVRKPDHLQRDHRMVERAQRTARCSCARSSISRRCCPRARPPSRSTRARTRTRRGRDQREDRRPDLQGRGRARGGPRPRRGRGGHGRAPRPAPGRGGGRGQHPLASPRWKRR